MAKRLLVLSASIGAGHVKAAEALCQSYTQNFGGEACHLDFFRYSTPRFSHWVEQAYYLVTKHTPAVYKLLYEIEDRPNSPIKKFEPYIGLKKYRAMLESFRPDIILCTHFLPAAVVSYMYSKYPIPNGVVLTDYVSHPMWVHDNNQIFFVAHEGMVDELKALGVAEEKVKVTGIPVRPMFVQRGEGQKLRIKFHLDPNLPVILLMSGGNAIGPLAEALESLAAIDGEFQVVAVTGRNRKTFHELKEVFAQSNLRGRVLGFVDNIHEWMAAADLLISKPGGLTVSEALASGLPMLLIRPTPGQEDGNTRYLTDAGVGIYLKDLSDLNRVVENLIHHPEILVEMGQQAQKIARPNATMDILKAMVEL